METFTSSTLSMMKRALSLAVTTSTPCFCSSGFSSWRAFSTAVTMATVLPPTWRWISRATTSLPPRRARLRFSLMPSTIVATSCSSMGRPALLPTITWLKSATDLALASTLTETSRLPWSRLPLGMASVSLARALFTAPRARPWASSFWGSIWTRISRVLTPAGSTLPTPGMFSMRRLRKSSAMRVSSRSFMPWCLASGCTTRESTGSEAGRTWR